MPNVLLVPELRELLEKKEYDILIDFCSSGHPAEIADFISALNPEEIREILLLLNPELRANIFSQLNEDLQLEITEKMDRRQLAQLITDMSSDDRVDLFKNLPEKTRNSLLPALAQAERDDILKLAKYKEKTVGAVMTSEYAALPAYITVKEALDKLRKEAPDKETIYYIYVIDENRKLIGFVSLKDLILAKENEKIANIMERNVISVNVNEDQEEAARKIQKYDLLAIPVIDDDNTLLGILTHDDVLDIVTQEQTEDIEKLMAISGEHKPGEYLAKSVWRHFLNRVYWIVSLAIIGLISGMIIHNFEKVLTQLIILALYMPMLADTGGNTGSQAATVVIRALALKEISPKDFFKVLFKELRIAILLSLVLGIITLTKVIFLSHDTEIPSGFTLPQIGIVIAVALSLQVIVSTLIGSVLPLIAVLLKIDPAVVASPALTTIVDITGLLIYFTTAKLLLGL